MLDFARHYGTSILPARPYHPQDKAKAESAVQVVERWIMARLRHQPLSPACTQVDAALAAVAAVRLNDRKPLPGSCPAAAPVAFAALDAPALAAAAGAALGVEPRFKSVRVHIDYHVEVDGHRYSVPH